MRTNNSEHDAAMASGHLSERREKRYAIAFDIEVSGIDSRGNAFHLLTVTKDVSEWGCSFVSSVELKRDEIVAIRLRESDDSRRPSAKPVVFQVMRVQRVADGWFIGAWKMGGENLWDSDLEKLVKPVQDALQGRRDHSDAAQAAKDDK